ncbi:MAG: DUF5131 family protein [Dehalococcoidales bacterium]|nr:DUF5131 family protein [Dehalococcoidales bacterium]
MNRTDIPWVKNPDGTPGFTVSPKTGCLNGCPYCYARKLANGRLKSRYLANPNIATPKVNYSGSGDDFTPGDMMDDVLKLSEAKCEAYGNPFYPRWCPSKLEQIRRRKKPAGIFLDDMSDWAADYWPEDWTRAEIETIKACPQHRFYLLTKQYKNLHKWAYPDNVWVGATTTCYSQFWTALPELRVIPAKVKFLSIEPFLERITSVPGPDPLGGLGNWLKESGISWVILGCQTKPVKLPERAWVDEIITACDKAEIPVFVKPPLSNLFNIHREDMPK